MENSLLTKRSILYPIIGYFSGDLLHFNAQQYNLVTALFAFQLVQSIPCGALYSLYLCALHYNYNDNSANMKAFWR